jgi:phosphoribosylglycinamide formyltransferase-1
MQRAIDIKNDDTPETLQRRIMENIEWKILPLSVELFCSGKIQVKNNKTIISE